MTLDVLWVLRLYLPDDHHDEDVDHAAADAENGVDECSCWCCYMLVVGMVCISSADTMMSIKL